MVHDSKTKRPKVGDGIQTWFSGRPDGLSTVISVRPYTGHYTEYFRWIVRCTAANTWRGWMEMSL